MYPAEEEGTHAQQAPSPAAPRPASGVSVTTPREKCRSSPRGRSAPLEEDDALTPGGAAAAAPNVAWIAVADSCSPRSSEPRRCRMLFLRCLRTLIAKVGRPAVVSGRVTKCSEGGEVQGREGGRRCEGYGVGLRRRLRTSLLSAIRSTVFVNLSC